MNQIISNRFFWLCLFVLWLGTSAVAGSGLIDNGDGTVTDVANGYMWQKTVPDQPYTFENARIYAGQLPLAGYGDWRVPDRDALRTLVKALDEPVSGGNVFTGVTSAYFWTSTMVDPASSRDSAWVIYFSNGFESQRHKQEMHYVRAVRDVFGGRLPADDEDIRAHISCFVQTLSGNL